MIETMGKDVSNKNKKERRKRVTMLNPLDEGKKHLGLTLIRIERNSIYFLIRSGSTNKTQNEKGPTIRNPKKPVQKLFGCQA